MNTYRTSSVGEAALLITLGHEPLRIEPSPYDPRTSEFVFPADAARDGARYAANDSVPAASYHHNLIRLKRALSARHHNARSSGHVPPTLA